MSKELKGLEELNKSVFEQWIFENEINKVNCEKFLEKINFSISDYNSEVNIYEKEPKDIIFLIILANWIKDTIELLIKQVKKEVLLNFECKNLVEEKAYIEAIRSFAVAHPMQTNRHNKFKFDGSFICNDIEIKGKYLVPLMKDEQFYSININGLVKGKTEFDYLLKVYSLEDNMKYFKYICCSIDDLTLCVSKYIDKLYDFANYLSKLKKNDIGRIQK